MFPDGSPAKDHDIRMNQLKSLSPEASELGEELEKLFDEWQPDGGERILAAQLIPSGTLNPGVVAAVE